MYRPANGHWSQFGSGEDSGLLLIRDTKEPKEIKVGDKVQIKSGGSAMTIKKVLSEGEHGRVYEVSRQIIK